MKRSCFFHLNSHIETIMTEISSNIVRYNSILSSSRLTDAGLIKDIEKILVIINKQGLIEDKVIIEMLGEEFGLAKNTAKYICPTLEKANLLLKKNNYLN
jgi:hypothetical protein